VDYDCNLFNAGHEGAANQQKQSNHSIPDKPAVRNPSPCNPIRYLHITKIYVSGNVFLFLILDTIYQSRLWEGKNAIAFTLFGLSVLSALCGILIKEIVLPCPLP
jgi:hypothetical protein